MLCHLGIFVFFVSRNFDDEVLCRVERRQADVASDTFCNWVLRRFLDLIVLEQVTITLIVIKECLDLCFQVFWRIIRIPIFKGNFMHVVHQDLLNPVEYANDRILFQRLGRSLQAPCV